MPKVIGITKPESIVSRGQSTRKDTLRLKNQSRRDNRIFLILHNIRSVYNVGSIFRTADAAGVSKIYLTGYTPDPAPKTALGAEKFIPFERGEISKIIKKLKSTKIQIIALEQSPKSVDYRKFRPKFPLALILGNEVRGLSRAILKKSDWIIQIPMRGKKESLNVSVAAGIALFELVGAFRKQYSRSRV